MHSAIYEYFILVLKEFVVGITLGYVSYLIFTAIYLAGHLIDMQIGFGVVNIIDPMKQYSGTYYVNFLLYIMYAYFPDVQRSPYFDKSIV